MIPESRIYNYRFAIRSGNIKLRTEKDVLNYYGKWRWERLSFVCSQSASYRFAAVNGIRAQCSNLHASLSPPRWLTYRDLIKRGHSEEKSWYRKRDEFQVCDQRTVLRYVHWRSSERSKRRCHPEARYFRELCFASFLPSLLIPNYFRDRYLLWLLMFAERLRDTATR